MKQHPFSFSISLSDGRPTEFDNHIVRRLSAMKGQYLDSQAYEALYEQQDSILYEVYEIKRPEKPGELLHGLSVVHPGKVGDEFYMTKGHFHTVLDTAELYYCLQGEGALVMETPEGDEPEWAVEQFYPGRVVYVPPRWGHRSINTSSDTDLITFFVYPGNAGHDYGTIERQGFRKLLVERNNQLEIIDNPRWRVSGENN